MDPLNYLFPNSNLNYRSHRRSTLCPNNGARFASRLGGPERRVREEEFLERVNGSRCRGGERSWFGVGGAVDKVAWACV